MKQPYRFKGTVTIKRWVEFSKYTDDGVTHLTRPNKDCLAKFSYKIVDGVIDINSFKMELV